MGNLRAQKRTLYIGSDTMTEYRREKQRMTQAAASIASKARRKRLEEIAMLVHNDKYAPYLEQKFKEEVERLKALEYQHNARIAKHRKKQEWLKTRKDKKTNRRTLRKYQATA